MLPLKLFSANLELANKRLALAFEMTRLERGHQSAQRVTTQTNLTALAQQRAQTALTLVTSDRQGSERLADIRVDEEAGAAQAQMRLIALEEERLRLAERNAVIGKEMEQSRQKAE